MAILGGAGLALDSDDHPGGGRAVIDGDDTVLLARVGDQAAEGDDARVGIGVRAQELDVKGGRVEEAAVEHARGANGHELALEEPPARHTELPGDVPGDQLRFKLTLLSVTSVYRLDVTARPVSLLLVPPLPASSGSGTIGTTASSLVLATSAVPSLIVRIQATMMLPATPQRTAENRSLEPTPMIAEEMTFPGQIKVTVIREKRAVNVAR